ncbi:AGAP009083-PA-like protein [Anopheles sinensis]|uniref:AGAP009083-PA-like protein n=1 Tax=Anopheles sinensis TaxID=74873 RepID=A0A084VMC8_ANOSI|nr:AGAP009083-PA-like protein [Anopheles sinensis]
MCLPFELRFLGTYLEELGRRDAPELRGAELKVNNPQEFIADIASGEPTDHRSRRKMALFLALYRACNHTCATELFKTLEGWGGRPDLQRLFEEDVQHELLLVYTMATNHPAFSFEQRLHCGEIFSKLKSWEPKANPKQSDRDEMMLPTQVPPPSVAPLHTLTPNAAGIPIQLIPQGPSTMGQGTLTLSYTGQPITQTIGNDGTITAYHLDPMLPLHTDFTIPPPGPPAASVQSRWVQNVYQQVIIIPTTFIVTAYEQSIVADPESNGQSDANSSQ